METYDEENMRDFVDVYLREISTSKDPSFNGELLFTTLSNLTKKQRSVSEEQLLVNAMDLFSAGSETTATTLAWAVRGKPFLAAIPYTQHTNTLAWAVRGICFLFWQEYNIMVAICRFISPTLR